MSIPVLWRRLDTPGHDACLLEQTTEGWTLQGAALFRHALGPARIEYAVECDEAWRSRQGRVTGWIGAQAIDVRVDRDEAGEWRVNGVSTLGLESCLDLDFGFTPATNLLQLRRVALGIGEAVDVPVAWLDVPEGSLVLLPQRYERRGATTYWYEAPTVGYTGLLEVAESGFARRYPRLWEMETQPAVASRKAEMTRKLISSGSTFERDIGYSRAVVDGDWVFVSGTTGFDYRTMTIAPGVVEQTEQCLRNIEAALAEAECSMRDVVRVTYVLPDVAEFPQCWPILRRYLGDVRPAAMMISAGLADPRMRIEIEVTARRQGRTP